MIRALALTSVLGLVAATTVVGMPATAAPPVAGFVGSANSSVAGCPYIAWRLARHENGDVTGIAYYSDMSGVSSVTGTVNQAGQFHLTLTSSMGNGPVGTVTGSRSAKGVVTAKLTGEGCANMEMHMNPVSNLNTYHVAGG